jgi:hypothetical protein
MRHSHIRPKVLAFSVSSILGISLLLSGCASDSNSTPIVTASPDGTNSETNISMTGGTEIIKEHWDEAVGEDVPIPETYRPQVEWYVYDVESAMIITEKDYPEDAVEKYIATLSDIDGITKMDPTTNETGYKSFNYQLKDVVIEIVIAPTLPDDPRSDTTVINFYTLPDFN